MKISNKGCTILVSGNTMILQVTIILSELLLCLKSNEK